MIALPPFCTCCRDMSSHDGGVEHLDEMCGRAHRSQRVEECLEHPRLAQSPEPLPNAIPLPEFGRQRPPRNVVDAVVMQRFQKRSWSLSGSAGRAALTIDLSKRPSLTSLPASKT